MTYQARNPHAGIPMRNIGALWAKESKKGEQYMSGYVEINGAKVDLIVFKNKQKREEKQPDYRIFPKEKREYQAKEPERNQEELADIPF